MRKIDKFKITFFLVYIILGVVLLRSVDVISGYQTKCIFDAIGFRCIGCGTTAALYKLKQGDIIGSLKENILGLTVVVMSTVLILNDLYMYIKRAIKGESKESIIECLLRRMFKGMKI